MKNTARKIVLTLLSTLFIIGSSFANGRTTDTSCLQLSGKVLKLKTNSSNSYTVALMRDHKVIETKIIKGNREFKFNLKKNKFYTIQILKEGYVPRTVSIDTKLDEEHDGLYSFEFDTELIDEVEAQKLNKEALEMPIAHIYFNPKKRWFTHNEAYTQEVKKNIYGK
ncbi:MAG: hypothetical protein JNJ41_14800 [Bacteroidia bacterium]|nr:hypothetical protein [Bacteroidia bacterium]